MGSVNRLKKKAGMVLTLSVMLLLTGCKKNEVYQGGEGTNFPYSWQERKNGTIQVTLDGSHAPDYGWVIESTDQSVVGVEVSKKEKNGVVTYLVKPLSEGNASVTFVRSRELPQELLDQAAAHASQSTESGAGDAEAATESEALVENGAGESEEDAGDVSKGEAPTEHTLEVERIPDGISILNGGEDSGSDAVSSEATAAEEASQAVMNTTGEGGDSSYDWLAAYEEKLQVRDEVSEITFQIEVSSTGKKGKLQAKVLMNLEEERKGLIRSKDASLDYKLWESDAGDLMIRIPYGGEAWMPTTLLPEGTESDQETVEVIRMQSVDGDECFELKGIMAGNVIVEFTSTASERKVVLELAMSETGRLTVLSHRAE